MPTHPNVILMATLKPDGLSRKTYRTILEKYHVENGDDQIKINNIEFTFNVMESDYDEGRQIAADEGDLVLFNEVTYGYGEVISWDDLENLKRHLEAWSIEVCKEFNCSYVIKVTANYW